MRLTRVPFGMALAGTLSCLLFGCEQGKQPAAGASAGGAGGSMAVNTSGAGGSMAVNASGAGGNSAGSSSTMGGGGSGSGSNAGGSPGFGADGLPAVCDRDQVLASDSGAKLKLQVHLKVGGQPLVFGEPNPLGANASVLPTNLRFYLSHPELMQASGERVPATFVSDAGTPKPYGVHLVNAEEPSTGEVELRAPAGEYTTVSFLLGVNDTCNGAYFPLEAPLDEASQLKWPHVFGFLFLRFEGSITGPFDDLGFTPPEVVHMGGILGKRFAPRVAFSGAWSLSDSVTTVAVAMDVEQILRGATLDADLDGYQFPPPAPPVIGAEIIAGERLRQHVVDLPLFQLELAAP